MTKEEKPPTNPPKEEKKHKTGIETEYHLAEKARKKKNPYLIPKMQALHCVPHQTLLELYTSTPSRGMAVRLKCKSQQNTDRGGVLWDPQTGPANVNLSAIF